MKTIYISNFFIKIVLTILLVQTTIYAQQDTLVTKKYPDIYGLSIGVDALGLSRNIWDKNYTGIEAQLEYRINKTLYAATEVGYVSKFAPDDRLEYQTQGTFLKLGVNKNYHKNWLNLNNQIYVGARYGMAFFSQELKNYRLITPGDYLGEEVIEANRTYSGLHAHWAEFLIGMKAEIYKNIFLGYSFRLHYMVFQKQPESFENLYIPGYGKKYDGNIGASFQYSISYLIPMKKKEIKLFKNSK